MAKKKISKSDSNELASLLVQLLSSIKETPITRKGNKLLIKTASGQMEFNLRATRQTKTRNIS